MYVQSVSNQKRNAYRRRRRQQRRRKAALLCLIAFLLGFVLGRIAVTAENMIKRETCLNEYMKAEPDETACKNIQNRHRIDPSKNIYKSETELVCFLSFLIYPRAPLRKHITDVTCTVNSAQAPLRHTKAPA